MPKRTSKREAILDTAKLLFSQKGYDAASMDEVASQTGVPKSLIYYHFKSKEELLKSVIQEFFNEFEVLLKDKSQNCISIDNRYYHFLEANSDFIRIILVESLKDKNKDLSIFDIVKRMMEFESGVSGNELLSDYQSSHSRWVAEFFTSIVPCVLFICFKDAWSSHFNADKEELLQDFREAYQLTHGEYHKSIRD